MWDEVPADHQNGIITGYTITYRSQTENDNGNVLVNGSVRQIELKSKGVRQLQYHSVCIHCERIWTSQ